MRTISVPVDQARNFNRVLSAAEIETIQLDPIEEGDRSRTAARTVSRNASVKWAPGMSAKAERNGAVQTRLIRRDVAVTDARWKMTGMLERQVTIGPAQSWG